MLNTNIVRKPLLVVIAAVLAFVALVPLVFNGQSSAYNIVTSRSIKMSSSANAATNVVYQVNFTTGSTHNIGSVAVEFCSNSPIIGDSCTAPSSFDVNEGSTQVYNQSGITDFSTTPHANTTSNRFVLTRTSASVSASTAVSFELGNGTNGITNPATTNTSFYARIYTYTATDGTGTEVDAGGVALSTAAQISVTSKVQERLVFCVYTSAVPGGSNKCSAVSGTAVTLGDTNGVLDPTGVYVDKNAKFAITTNATSSAIVRFKGSTLYRNADTGCSSASNCVTEFTGTPNTSTAGSEEFGLCAYQSVGTGLTVDTVYDGGAGAECSGTTQSAGTGTPGGDNSAEFALDTDTGSGTRSTYGDTLATKTAGDYSVAILPFAGNISNTTEAGIYATTFTFIATGTY